MRSEGVGRTDALLGQVFGHHRGRFADAAVPAGLVKGALVREQGLLELKGHMGNRRFRPGGNAERMA